MAAQSEAVHLLLQRARTELTLPRQRAFAAVVGAAVADAAAVRCHWQYDAEALRTALAGREPLFAEEAQNPFYRVAAGRNSCYGDQLRCVVASLARTRGAFDGDDVAAALRERMTAPDYEASTATRNERAAYRDDQRAAAPPLEGPWRHGTIQRFLDGAVDDADASADALLRAIPVAARAAVDGKGDDEVAAVADAAARVTQRSPVARSHAAAVAVAVARLVAGAETTPRAAVAAAAASPAVDAAARATLDDCLACGGEPSLDGAVAALREQLGFDGKPAQKMIA